MAIIDPERYPVTAAYVASLPGGLDAYPECQAKASLYRTFVTSTVPDDLPDVLRDLVVRPRPVTAWIPEAHSHSLLLAHYDFQGHDEGSFARFCYTAQRELWNSKLYAFLMQFISPVRLLDRAGLRWTQFHRGSALEARRLGEREATLELSHPRGLWDRLSLVGLTEGIRAVLDVSRARARIELTHVGDAGARWRVSWHD